MESGNTSLLYILLITTSVSVLGLVGGLLLFWKERATKRWAHFFMSFAAGGLLGAAFFDLLPEALESGETSRVLWYTLLGILVFFVVEKSLVWHHHSHEHDTDEEDDRHAHLPQGNKALGPLIIIGDGLHNFLDGAIIAIAFIVDPNLGWITALAVIAHEIPQEVGDFSILLSSGMRRGRALFWNLLGALLGTVGALVGYTAHETFEGIEIPLLAFAAGNFIYIALADLFPSIQHDRKPGHSIGHVALVVVGLGILYLLGLVFPHAHSG